MINITIEELNTERSNWLNSNGNGRNHQDQRFGQYLANKYGYSGNVPDIFYTESVDTAYTRIMEYHNFDKMIKRSETIKNILDNE